ncbi:F0F1 ATP synthase subunit delta [Naumannella huperziae]
MTDQQPELDLETGHLLAGHNVAGQETRLGTLDTALDRILGGRPEAAGSIAPDLFAVVDALDAQPALRRALTDPGTPARTRKGVAERLFGGRIGDSAVALVADAAALRWSSMSDLAAALEREAVRAELIAAQADGNRLDAVEDELFRFERLVAGDRPLRDAIADRSVSVAGRADLVGSLLQGKADPATALLARRAVAARERTFARTLEHYLVLAAELRRRAVATVRVARPLDGEQFDRLQAALSKSAGRAIAMHVIVDPSIIGGVRVQLGDEVIEGTMAARLDEARRTIR